MTDETKLTRMSRILDNAVRLQSRSQRVRDDAYKRVMESLERAISDEERTRKEMEDQAKLQSEAEMFQRDLRKSIERQRVLVLQQQMQEKELRRKQEKDWSHFVDSSYPDIPVTPFDLRRKYCKEQQSTLRTELEKQIQEKDRMKNLTEEQEKLMDQFRVEMAKLSMEKDLEAQKEKRRFEQNVLVQSWTQHMHTQQLKRNVDRISQFPISYFNRGSTYSRDYSRVPLLDIEEKEEITVEKPENAMKEEKQEEGPQPQAVETTIAKPAEPVPKLQNEAKIVPNLPSSQPNISALAQLVTSQRSQRAEEDRQSRISYGRRSLLSGKSQSPARPKEDAERDRASSLSSRTHISIVDRLQELTQAEGDIQKEKAKLLRQLNTTRKSTPAGKVTVGALLQQDATKQAQTIIAQSPAASPAKPSKPTPKEKPQNQSANVGDFLKSVFA